MLTDNSDTAYDRCDDCQRQSGSTYCPSSPSSLSRRSAPTPRCSVQNTSLTPNAALVCVVKKDKLTIKVGDTLVKVQVGLTLTVIGSKDAPKGDLAEAA